MLRVLFPTTVYSDEAFYGIQFGYVKRPTHRNTSWDLAKFEVPAHKYADLSDNTKGAAIFTDCKYGFKIHENIMEMNLLRSPTYPDPDADIGKQTFKIVYVLFWISPDSPLKWISGNNFLKLLIMYSFIDKTYFLFVY